MAVIIHGIDIPKKHYMNGYYISDDGKVFDVSRKNVVGKAVQISSEEPEPHWIPCSERLPDYEGYDEVLTTVNGRAENVRYINAVITNAEYDDTDKQWYINGCAAKWVARNGKVMSDVDVLAWMPLPEPWKGEEE